MSWAFGSPTRQRIQCRPQARGGVRQAVDLTGERRRQIAPLNQASLAEIDRWRERLGDRMIELTLTELTRDPKLHIMRLAEHFGLNPPTGSWLDHAAATIEPEPPIPAIDLPLPPMMADMFNQYQSRFGFQGRARVL